MFISFSIAKNLSLFPKICGGCLCCSGSGWLCNFPGCLYNLFCCSLSVSIYFSFHTLWMSYIPRLVGNFRIDLNCSILSEIAKEPLLVDDANHDLCLSRSYYTLVQDTLAFLPFPVLLLEPVILLQQPTWVSISNGFVGFSIQQFLRQILNIVFLVFAAVS